MQFEAEWRAVPLELACCSTGIYIRKTTTGYRIDPVQEKKIVEYIIIGYASTKTEGLHRKTATFHHISGLLRA